MVIDSNLTGVRYRNECIRPHIPLLLQPHERHVTLQQNNACPNVARVVTDFTGQQNIPALLWPGVSGEIYCPLCGMKGSIVYADPNRPVTLLVNWQLTHVTFSLRWLSQRTCVSSIFMFPVIDFSSIHTHVCQVKLRILQVHQVMLGLQRKEMLGKGRFTSLHRGLTVSVIIMEDSYI